MENQQQLFNWMFSMGQHNECCHIWASLFLCPVSDDIGVFHWLVISGPLCLVSSGENFTGNSSSTKPNVSTFLPIPEPLRESFCKWYMRKNSPLSPSVCIYLDCIHRLFSKSFQLQVCCFITSLFLIFLKSLASVFSKDFHKLWVPWNFSRLILFN